MKPRGNFFPKSAMCIKSIYKLIKFFNEVGLGELYRSGFIPPLRDYWLLGEWFYNRTNFIKFVIKTKDDEVLDDFAHLHREWWEPDMHDVVHPISYDAVSVMNWMGYWVLKNFRRPSYQTVERFYLFLKKHGLYDAFIDGYIPSMDMTSYYWSQNMMKYRYPAAFFKQYNLPTKLTHSKVDSVTQALFWNCPSKMTMEYLISQALNTFRVSRKYGKCLDTLIKKRDAVLNKHTKPNMGNFKVFGVTTSSDEDILQCTLYTIPSHYGLMMT